MLRTKQRLAWMVKENCQTYQSSWFANVLSASHDVVHFFLGIRKRSEGQHGWFEEKGQEVGQGQGKGESYLA